LKLLLPVTVISFDLTHYLFHCNIVSLDLLDIDFQHSLTIYIFVEFLVQTVVLEYIFSRTVQRLVTVSIEWEQLTLLIQFVLSVLKLH